MSPVDRAGMDGSHQQRNDLLDTGLKEQQRKKHLIHYCTSIGLDKYFKNKYMFKCLDKIVNELTAGGCNLL